MMVQYMESVASLTAQHYVQRINKLLENQVWTFGQWNVEFGRTLTGPKNVIALDCGIIRTLIEGKITLAERCTLQFYLAHLVSRLLSTQRVYTRLELNESNCMSNTDAT